MFTSHFTLLLLIFGVSVFSETLNPEKLTSSLPFSNFHLNNVDSPSIIHSNDLVCTSADIQTTITASNGTSRDILFYMNPDCKNCLYFMIISIKLDS